MTKVNDDNRPLALYQDAKTGNRLLPYSTPEGVELDLVFDGDEPWFTQLDLSTMFGVDLSVANRHVANFIEDGELDESTIAEFARVRTEGDRQVTRQVKHYNLDVAFYVGYRVNSTEGKLFRRWATDRLVQLATNGFVVNKRILKGAPDRLAKLREIIQDIRADEASVYAELRRILSMCSDYDPGSKASQLFFAKFQNHLLYAITGQTAAGIKIKQADASKENMGLQTWEGDHPLQSDALRAKSYLGALQIEDLNRLTTMVLDFFEDQTKREWITTTADAEQELHNILSVNKRKILPDGPQLTKAAGDTHVKAEYAKFDKERRAIRKELALNDLSEAAEMLAILGPAPKSKKKK